MWFLKQNINVLHPCKELFHILTLIMVAIVKCSTSLNCLLEKSPPCPQLSRIAMKKHATRPGNVANWLNFRLQKLKNMQTQPQIIVFVTFKQISIDFLHKKQTINAETLNSRRQEFLKKLI